MRRFFMLGIMLLAGATGPRAEDKPGDWLNPYHLEDTIVVTANRLATPVSQTASSVTVITAKEIQQSQATNLAEALRSVPGLNVVQSGGPGQQTSLFLRGANAEHVLVLIDGVKINDPSSPNNATNLANLGVANIDRIEILRGPQSVLYGSDAVGGIIQIFTKRGTGRPEINLSAEGGSLNTYSEQLAVRAGQEQHDYSVTLSRHSTDGISASRNGVEKDGYANTTVAAAAGLRPSSKIQLRLTGQASESDVDLDQGYGVLDDPNYTMYSKEQYASARLDHDISRGLWRQQFGAYLTRYERRTIDRRDTNHPDDTSSTHYDGLRIKYDWQLAAALRESLRMTVGAETESDQLNQRLFYLPVWSGDSLSKLGVVKSRTSGMYAMGELSREGLGAITAGGRFDHHDQFGDHGTYRLTGVYHLNLLRLKLRATYGTGFKSPSLYQIYDPGTGNPRLNPEASRGGEVGLDYHPHGDAVSTGITYFHTDFDDLIQFQSTTGHMGNVARARSLGVETYGSLDLRQTRIYLSYTYTEAVDRDSSQFLLRRPKNKVSLQAEQQVVPSFLMRGDIIYTGKRYDVDYTAWPPQRVTLHDYTLMNLAGSYTLRDGFRLSARIDNLFNTEYEEVWSYESMPRTVSLGVEATF